MPETPEERWIKMMCPGCDEETVYILVDPPVWVGRVARLICPACLKDVRWRVADAAPALRGRRFEPVGSGCAGHLVGESRLMSRVEDASPAISMAALDVVDITPEAAAGLRTVRVRRGFRGRLLPVDPDFEWGRPRAEDRSAAYPSR